MYVRSLVPTVVAGLLVTACGDHVAETARLAPTAPLASGGCSGPTVKEQLSGPAIGGVVPEGEARADESQFPCGGNTILTVRVKNVNYPDGTVLRVTLDFQPFGNITLSKREGVMTANLGHFAVSNDEVRVYKDTTQILIGPFFR
jgi:hypothetical protein